ncbi:MAG: hypothetical protein ACK4RK_15920 [Gemmataceae bacterium]
MNRGLLAWAALVVLPMASQSQELTWPPQLPGGQKMVTISAPNFLKGPADLKPGVQIAKTPPTVDFMYYDCQEQRPKGYLWSAWGDCLAVGNKCYSAIGDHGPIEGNAYVYEYDADKKELRQVVDVRKVLNLPSGHYTPGKIHSRIDMGSDGCIYFSTHRGSTRTTTPANHYSGDWIFRYDPKTDKTEIVAHAPLPMQCMPASVLDPERMIFYAGTQDGANSKPPSFLAYDVKNRKLLYSNEDGPSRAMILAKSTGRVYWNETRGGPPRSGLGASQLVRFDPAKPGAPVPIDAELGLRAASQESPDGKVYTANGDNLWVFDTKTEKAEHLGPAVVGKNEYIATMELDPKTNRYLYYIAGAHGGSHNDGSPLVQYDVKTKTRKVIAFLHPTCHEKYHFIPCGTYGVSVSPEGDKVYIVWNGNRDTPVGKATNRVKFDICGFMVVHVPESERQP